jgi:hypothetical protein
MTFYNPTASVAHQTTIASRPRANIRFAQGSNAARANVCLARGPCTPQVAFRLARGSPSTLSVLPTPPDRGINCLVTSLVPWSKGEPSPRWIPESAWESGPGAVRTAHHYAAIPGVVQVVCEVAAVIPRHCVTCSSPSPTSRPSKKDGYTLEDVRPLTWRSARTTSWHGVSGARLRAAIPSLVPPFLTLWNHPLHCGRPVPMGHPHASPVQHEHPVSNTLELMYERRPAWTPARRPSKLRRVRKPPRRLWDPGFVETSIKS